MVVMVVHHFLFMMLVSFVMVMVVMLFSVELGLNLKIQMSIMMNSICSKNFFEMHLIQLLGAIFFALTRFRMSFLSSLSTCESLRLDFSSVNIFSLLLLFLFLWFLRLILLILILYFNLILRPLLGFDWFIPNLFGFLFSSYSSFLFFFKPSFFGLLILM